MKTILYFTLTLITLLTLTFVPNSFAQEDSPEYVVRLIYFLPSDREPQPDIDTDIDSMIKEVQQFYADQMEAHKFGRKTFQLETDAHGNAIVHHITGKFEDKYYVDAGDAYVKAWNEVGEVFDTSQNVYLVVIDTSDERISGERHVAGRAKPIGYRGGLAAISTFGILLDASTAAHEIGHTFGLLHDFSSTDRIMSWGPTSWGPGGSAHLSKCAAEWLDVHPHFNTNQPQTADNAPTMLKMLPTSFVSAPNTIRLRFEITDANGLHQAQLFVADDPNERGILDCKYLDGNQHTTVEFITTEIIPKDEDIRLKVIDVHGNQWGKTFPIDITSVLPSPNTVSIPNLNLAAAVRKEIGDSITTQTMQNLIKLSTVGMDIQITNLAGLEHAHHLKVLQIDGPKPFVNDQVVLDLSPLAGLSQLKNLSIVNMNIADLSDLEGLTKLEFLLLYNNGLSDISPLAKLTNLKSLQISDNLISNVSALGNLTQLSWLKLPRNNISDISPLAKLKRLTYLDIEGNPISDISPLENLTQLHTLYLTNLGISDVSPLAKLTELRSLQLWTNRISDISPLANLTQLRSLILTVNKISDVSALSKLIRLERLNLLHNQISDVSPLKELVNLQELHLHGNPIKNRKPLYELLEKNPDIKIYLKWGGKPLPVNLSHFRAELSDAGVILKWTTESEVDNAGFYIYRSETKDGEFKVVNPTMIQGAGTTGERNEYTWTDTIAKPNTVYYYRIEDVSHAGVREQLGTVRLRGLVSASGKLTTRWADLKAEH